MSSGQTWKLLAALAAAAGMTVLAVSTTAHYLSGTRKPFEQRPAPPEDLAAIEAMTGELLKLDRDAREERLRQVVSPDAPAGAIEALAAQFESLKRATECGLVAAEAYGPKHLRAIYRVVEPGGAASEIALFFERRGTGLVLLDAAR